MAKLTITIEDTGPDEIRFRLDSEAEVPNEVEKMTPAENIAVAIMLRLRADIEQVEQEAYQNQGVTSDSNPSIEYFGGDVVDIVDLAIERAKKGDSGNGTVH